MPTYQHILSIDSTRGNHYFDGEPIIYSEANLCVDPLEMDWMVSYLRELAYKHNGLDFIQRFKNAKGDVLCFYSPFSQEELQEMREDGETDLYHLNRFEVYFQNTPEL